MAELGFPPYQKSYLHSKTHQAFLQIFPLFNQIPTPSQTPSKSEKLIPQKDEVEEGEICEDKHSDTNLSDDQISVEIEQKTTDSGVITKRVIAKEKIDEIEEGEICDDKQYDTNLLDDHKKMTDFGVKTKRVITKERKEKKKANKRKQRAEQDRQSGVKRLKLLPNINPKTVNYCKYYLNGKCQKGDDCKFSHDTVPLTKSKPCNFFALKKCLKGDDCPYDHELSKYPCNNFTSKGYCSRGNSCLFSHKILPMSDPAPLPPDVNKPTDSGAVRSDSKPAEKVCSEPKGQSVLQVKPPAQMPKGIRFLSFGKTPINQNLGRKLESTLAISQPSKITRHAAPPVSKAPSSSQCTSNYQSKVLNQPSLVPHPMTNTPTVSSILQEFLFNGK